MTPPSLRLQPKVKSALAERSCHHRLDGYNFKEDIATGIAWGNPGLDQSRFGNFPTSRQIWSRNVDGTGWCQRTCLDQTLEKIV